MRGSGSFAPAALAEALAPLSGTEAEHPEALEDYRRFYALSFSGARHRIGSLEAQGYRIAVQTFEPADARGTALVCHGYYDHVGLYGHLVEWLLSRGLNVVAFDQPGHGLSSGARATIDSFDEYVAAMRIIIAEVLPMLPRPWYAVAQSMGGSVVMEYLCQHENPFRSVALLAPLVRPYAWGVNRWVYEVLRHVIDQRKRTITANAENPEFMALMKKDPLAPQVLPVRWVTAMVEWMDRFERYPTLPFSPVVVQGHADRTVDWRYGIQSLRDRSDLRLLEIPTARHHLVNESVSVRREMFGWLAEQLGI